MSALSSFPHFLCAIKHKIIFLCLSKVKICELFMSEPSDTYYRMVPPWATEGSWHTQCSVQASVECARSYTEENSPKIGKNIKKQSHFITDHWITNKPSNTEQNISVSYKTSYKTSYKIIRSKTSWKIFKWKWIPRER